MRPFQSDKVNILFGHFSIPTTSTTNGIIKAHYQPCIYARTAAPC